MDFFPPTPIFTDGQVMSAGAHMNALRACASYLLGMYQGGATPWARDIMDPTENSWNRIYTEDGWRVLWRGWLRQKTTTLHYQITALQAGYAREIRIVYNGAPIPPNLTVTAGAGTQTFTGTKTLPTSAGSTYEIKVEGYDDEDFWKDFQVVYLREEYTVALPTLAAFSSGTPTAEQWQDLSDMAQGLYEQMRVPLPMVPRYFLGKDSSVRFNVTHRSNTLAYRVRWRPPYRNTETGQLYSMWLRLYVNGSLLATIGGQGIFTQEVAEGDTTIPGFSYLWEGAIIRADAGGELILLGSWNAGLASWTGCTRGWGNTSPYHYHTDDTASLWQQGGDKKAKTLAYFGTIPLASLGLGDGDDYELKFTVEGTKHLANEELVGSATLDLLTEQADDIGVPSWWSDMSAWAHGDNVDGTPDVKPIRDNLVALSDRMTALVYPAMWNRLFLAGGRVRQHRWLHYRCETQKDETRRPAISWNANGRQETSLPFEPNKWKQFDLEEAKGLFVGGAYELHDLSAAFEDIES